MDPLLHMTVRCAGLNCSELAETVKRRVSVVTPLPRVPHTVTGFIIFCQTGWHGNKRRAFRSAIMFWFFFYLMFL